MNIITLGTSHGNHTYCRFNSATLLEIGNHSYLVDCGEGAHALMVRAGRLPERLRAVFVTHMHQDHVGGVPDLIKRLAKYPEKGRTTAIYLPEAQALPALADWCRAMHVDWPSPVVTLRVATPGTCHDDGEIHVAAVPTRHMAELGAPSLAYVLNAEGKRLVFTGDLRSDFSDFPKAAMSEPCDVCVCEITHFSPARALPTLANCPIKRLILNHVHDPWHGAEGEARLRAAFATLPYPFSIAHDGDQFLI